MISGLPQRFRHIVTLLGAALVLMGAFAGAAQAGQVTQVSVTDSPPSAAAGARTVYKVSFVTATGPLSGGSTITISFSTGTGLGILSGNSVTDTTSGLEVGGDCNDTANENRLVETCYIFDGDTVTAGNAVTVELDGVTNPTTVSSTDTVSVSTSSDTQATSSSYSVAGPQKLTMPSVTLSSLEPDASGVDYVISFATSSTGGLSGVAGSTITISFPSGTGLGDLSDDSVTDTTSGLEVGGDCNNAANENGLVETCYIFDTAAARDAVTVELDGVTNPTTISSSSTLQAATSSDIGLVTSNPYEPAAPPPPGITGVNPSTGPVSGGAQVTITGTNLTGATAVKFGTTNATSFTVNSATSVTATSPAESAGTVDITVTTAGGTSATSSADKYTYLPAPTVTQVAPTQGPTTGGTSVTITGTSFTNATAVQFGTANATSFTVANGGNSITATAPAESAGVVNITVTAPGGTSPTGTADQYTYAAAPTVTNINPPAGPTAGGTTVTITGTNLANATAVKFGATNATGFTVGNGGNSITATAPAESAVVVNVTVTTAGGTSGTGSPDQYTYVAVPTVTSVNPASGSTAGGNTVTIIGTNLLGATAVKLGGVSATNVNPINATEITATAPAEPAGTVDMTVTTLGGTSATSPADQYRYVQPAPSVTGVSPASGPVTGGTSVTITGTNLSGATAVSFGNTTAASFSVISATQITAISPGEPAGTVDITVTTAGGTSATGTADQFTYTAQITTTGTGTTTATPPSVTPSPPSVPNPTSAGFAGQVNPNGLATTAYFEYGIDPSDRGPGSSPVLYDQTTPVQTVGSDTTNHAISIPVTGLVPNALYHVALVASNGAGTTVGPDQTFTTPASTPPPPPVLGQAVNVTPVSGQVFIEPPPGKTLTGARDSAALSKGTGFVPLTEARQIPTGSEIDALHGSLKIVSNTGQVGKTQTATLTGGVFKLTQARTGITKGLASFNLVENAFQGAPSYSLCQATKHKTTNQASAASLSTKTLQLLKVSGHGKFRTTGHYSSATVRGTIYTVADRCDGTLTHVIRDTVLVDDFARHKTILLHAGQSYLAKKP